MCPLLILCTARPELLDRRQGWGGGKRNATTISLAPLSQHDTAELVSSLLDGRLQMERRTELLDARRRKSALRGGVRAHARAGRGGASAAGVRPGNHRRAPRHAASGREDPRPGRGDRRQGLLAGRPGPRCSANCRDGDVEQPLHALERKEFVRRERRSSIAGEAAYVFRHVLVRDVAYSQIPRRRRADMHRLAAGWMEAARRATVPKTWRTWSRITT